MKKLSNNVKNCLEKALDSALLAVETYNKPAVKFKSGGYIVLMSIAWTSPLHAIFLKQKIKPFYKDKAHPRRYKRVNGELQFWELETCVNKYFQEESGIKSNLKLFIPLRNKIEHKFMPELDSNIFAECEALLLNFDKIVEKEFGIAYCLRESLSFALQLFPSSKTLSMCIKGNKEKESVVKFINGYRDSISTDILKSGEYSFKAFLVQVVQHNSVEALPIQFYQYDKLTEEQKKVVDRVAGLIKEKQIPVANKDKLKPGKVIEMVQAGLGNPQVEKNGRMKNKFNQDTFVRCWKKYKIRPENHSPNPERTEAQYCVYDEPNGSYLYTYDFVEFLITKMDTAGEYESLYH